MAISKYQSVLCTMNDFSVQLITHWIIALQWFAWYNHFLVNFIYKVLSNYNPLWSNLIWLFDNKNQLKDNCHNKIKIKKKNLSTSVTCIHKSPPISRVDTNSSSPPCGSIIYITGKTQLTFATLERCWHVIL